MTIIRFPGEDGQGDADNLSTELEPEAKPKPNRKRRSAQELVILRSELWKDRISGKTYEQISIERNVPLRTVIYNCQAAVRELDATAFLEEEMAVSLAQLTKIQELHWPDVLAKDPDATDLFFKAHDRKVKLLGLEAPKRIDISGEIAIWAAEQGLDPADVIEATATLLPVAKPPSYSTG